MSLWRSLAQRPLIRLHAFRGPVCRAKRLVSTTPTPRSFPSNLIPPLRQTLTNDQHRRALGIFYEYMRENELDSESRFTAYVRTITLFMIHGHLKDACTIYARMQAEGYIPPRPIQATLAIMRTLAVETSQEALLRAAAKAFYADSFSEEDFRTVLRIIYRQTRLSSSVYDALIDLFIQSRRQSDYTLSDKTQAWLSYIRTRRGPPGQIHQYPVAQTGGSPAPAQDEPRESEFSALREMAKRDPEIAPVIHSSLKRMEFSGGANDRIFYNVILSTMVVKMRYEEAFTLYRMLMAGDTTILPDAFTFGTLFGVLKALSGPRTARTRGTKRPSNTPSFRELYRDMLYCHQKFAEKKASDVAINGSLLNKVVQNLVETRDYAAAFVAVRSYDVLKVPVTLATYRAVINGLILRVKMELSDLQRSDDRDQYWTYRFLGCPAEIPSIVDVRLAEYILQSGGQAALELDPYVPWTEEDLQKHAQALDAYMATDRKAPGESITYRHLPHARDGRRGYRVPTGVTLLGILESRVETFSATPLQRILRRALLAEHPRTFITPSKVVSMDIRHAKSEMMPAPSVEPPSDV